MVEHDNPDLRGNADYCTDDGTLEGLTVYEAYVLGYEVADVEVQILNGKPFTRQVRHENRGRIARCCRDLKRKFSMNWLSTIDQRTRATHAAADSQKVPNKQPFVVGGYSMQHPGDGSGGAPASEIVACRCCATGFVG